MFANNNNNNTNNRTVLRTCVSPGWLVYPILPDLAQIHGPDKVALNQYVCVYVYTYVYIYIYIYI